MINIGQEQSEDSYQGQGSGNVQHVFVPGTHGEKLATLGYLCRYKSGQQHSKVALYWPHILPSDKIKLIPVRHPVPFGMCRRAPLYSSC